MAEGGLELVEGDLGGDGFRGESGGEGGFDVFLVGTVLGEVVDEEGESGFDCGFDLVVGEPDEVGEADVEHVRGGGGYVVDLDGGGGELAFEGGGDAVEVAGVDEALGSGAEVVGGEGGAGVEVGGIFKLLLSKGAELRELDPGGGVGLGVEEGRQQGGNESQKMKVAHVCEGNIRR